MTALLYIGHSYEAQAASPKACIELTYRREHFTPTAKKSSQCSSNLMYRGFSYAK